MTIYIPDWVNTVLRDIKEPLITDIELNKFQSDDLTDMYTTLYEVLKKRDSSSNSLSLLKVYAEVKDGIKLDNVSNGPVSEVFIGSSL